MKNIKEHKYFTIQVHIYRYIHAMNQTRGESRNPFTRTAVFYFIYYKEFAFSSISFSNTCMHNTSVFTLSSYVTWVTYMTRISRQATFHSYMCIKYKYANLRNTQYCKYSVLMTTIARFHMSCQKYIWSPYWLYKSP